MWGQENKAELRFGLGVPKSGILQFDWHARSSRATQDSVAFELRFPHSLANRLTLDLPVGLRPAIAGGVVLESFVERPGARTHNSQPDVGLIEGSAASRH